MKKIGLGLLFIFILNNCKVNTPYDLKGSFSKIGKDYSYKLDIGSDSTFTFGIKVQDARPECTGKILYFLPDSVRLICNEEDVYAMLGNGYLNERENLVKVISRNKLKVRGINLKRQK